MCRRAFDLGITHFDLANNYGPPPGAAEEFFGRFMAIGFPPLSRRAASSPPRPATTCGRAPTANGASRKYLLASLDQSLKRMGLDYVDIFYSHRFDPDTPLEETMGALDTAVRQGKALYVGISSYSSERTARGRDDPARSRHAGRHPPAELFDAQSLDGGGQAARPAREGGHGRHLLLAAGAGPAHQQVPEGRSGGQPRARAVRRRGGKFPQRSRTSPPSAR